jgi:hypothetical protein
MRNPPPNGVAKTPLLAGSTLQLQLRLGEFLSSAHSFSKFLVNKAILDHEFKR